MGLLAPRLAALPDRGLHTADGLRELRVGLNIVDLRRARHGLPPLRVVRDGFDARRTCAGFPEL